MRFCDKFQTLRPSPFLGASLLVAGLVLATGCDAPDPEGRFDEFGEKTADRRIIPDVGSPDGGQQVDFSGTYLFSLATTLAPAAPLYLQADVTVDTSDFTIDFVFQPLTTDFDTDAMSRGDGARVAVGPAIEVNDVPLSESGQFEVDLGTVEVDGSANPISGGDIVATIQIQGFVLSTTEWCGTATGDVTVPTALPLEGSTFGAAVIIDDIKLVDPVSMCTSGVVPVPDGGNNDADTGPEEPFIRCPAGLEGDYDFIFKADVSDDRTQLTMRLTAGDGINTPCYTGELISQTDGTTVVGNVDFLDDKDEVLTGFIPDFMIPPGASALLPDGGVAELDLRATAWTEDGACGELTFSLLPPAITISSPGGFAMLRQGSADYSFDADTTNATCTAIIPTTPCGLDAWAGTYQLKFLSETQRILNAPPTLVELNLAAHPLTCLAGDWMSVTTADFKLADVAWVEPLAPDQANLYFRNFVIPPNPDNPVAILADGARADALLTTTMAVPGTSMCGDLVIDVFDPVEISSDGKFAADQTEPAQAACP